MTICLQTVVEDVGLEVLAIVELKENPVELGHAVLILPEGGVALGKQPLDVTLGEVVVEEAGGEVRKQSRHDNETNLVVPGILSEELDSRNSLHYQQRLLRTCRTQ